MSFANLKSGRTDISKLVSAAQEVAGGQKTKNKYEDDRIWKPTVDDAGNGYAVIRFLPETEGQELPWERYWDHGFKGPTGQWYIEKSLTSIGQKDPVGELNSRLWNSGNEEDKETARKQKRRLHYISNVLIVSVPANPQNEGQVKLFVYGKKIFDKIMDVMQPQFPGETPVNPFNFWEGADFQLKIRNVAGYRNYDKSEFKSPNALFDADETRLEATYNQLFELREFVDPANYKSYEDLNSRLQLVLGHSVGAGSTMKNEALTQSAEAAPVSSSPEPTIVAAPQPTIESSSNDEDDSLSYFAKMAAEE